MHESILYQEQTATMCKMKPKDVQRWKWVPCQVCAAETTLATVHTRTCGWVVLTIFHTIHVMVRMLEHMHTNLSAGAGSLSSAATIIK